MTDQGTPSGSSSPPESPRHSCPHTLKCNKCGHDTGLWDIEYCCGLGCQSCGYMIPNPAHEPDHYRNSCFYEPTPKDERDQYWDCKIVSQVAAQRIKTLREQLEQLREEVFYKTDDGRDGDELFENACFTIRHLTRALNEFRMLEKAGVAE